MMENPEMRSRVMSRIRSKNTRPEMAVRRLVHSMGYRYRLHGPSLPGRPDLVFAGRRKLIFVNGCFWHSHDNPDCKLSKLPKSRLGYWGPKLDRNRKRDAANIVALSSAGWSILVIWECETSDLPKLGATLRAFLEGDNATESMKY